MSPWEARRLVVQAALDLASASLDPFGETRDPFHGAGIELREDALDHAISEYTAAKAAEEANDGA